MVVLDILSLLASQFKKVRHVDKRVMMICGLVAVVAASFAWVQNKNKDKKSKERGGEKIKVHVSFNDDRCVRDVGGDHGRVSTMNSRLMISTTPSKSDNKNNDSGIWERLYNELRKDSGITMKRMKGGKVETMTLRMNDNGELFWPRRKFPRSTNLLHVGILKDAFLCECDGTFILSFPKKILHLETINRDKATAHALVDGLLSMRNEFNGSMLRFASQSSSSRSSSGSVFDDSMHSVSDSTCTTTTGMSRSSSFSAMASGAIAGPLSRFGSKIHLLRRRMGSSNREIKVIEHMKTAHVDFD